MEVSFLGQPFPSDSFGGWTAEWLQHRLSNHDVDQIRIAVAWAKRSGLSRLYDSLTAFKARNGKISIIVGIDEGGATEQGLQLALDLFNDVHIFHDPATRTFHPKVYLASGPSSAELVVGSNNVTAGGLFSNYEAALTCDLDLTRSKDQQLLTRITSWFDTLYSDTNACKLLTPDLLAVLIKDSQYNIANEDQPKRGRPRNEEDYDGVAVEPTQQSIFSRSLSKKRAIPPKVYVPSEPPAGKRRQEQFINTGSTPSSTRISILRWTKRLSASDAQHPPNANSAATGNLKVIAQIVARRGAGEWDKVPATPPAVPLYYVHE